MAKVENKMALAEIRKKYDHIDCFFTQYDGEKASFDFYGTDASGTEVRISLGGCAAWIKHMAFGPKDPLNISDAMERHVRYVSITDNRGTVIYEQIFDTN